jgi:hypothetical protein
VSERRCPREHKGGHCWPLDRYLDGSGWKCPGLAPDGSDCGYMEPDDNAVRLLEEALHLRMNGERAPGGNETWREWDRKAEEYLRDVTATQESENKP